MIEDAYRSERKRPLLLNNSGSKIYSKALLGQHLGIRDSQDSNSGFSATTRGLITRPSPMPPYQRRVTGGSTLSSENGGPSLPPLNPTPNPRSIEIRKQSASETKLSTRTPHFQRDRPEKALKVMPAATTSLQRSPLSPKKKLSHSKSICKQITL